MGTSSKTKNERKIKNKSISSQFTVRQAHLSDDRVTPLWGAHVRREKTLGGAVGSSDDDVADEHATPFFPAAVIQLSDEAHGVA